jgi:hypothetical protein
MANITIKRYNGSAWDIHYPKTIISQVVNLSTTLANMQDDIDGKAASSHSHSAASIISGELSYLRVRQIRSADTRNENPEPSTYPPSASFDFKSNSIDGLSDGGTYHGVLSYRPYGSSTDYSGGPMHQMAFTQNANIFNRKSLSATSWGEWIKLLNENDIAAWAKASSKPSYTAAEVGAAAASHNHTKSQITDFPSNIIRQVSFSSGTLVVEVV